MNYNSFARVEIYRIFFGAFRKEFYSLITYIFSGAIQSLRARTILPAAQAAQLNEEAFDFSLPNQSLPPQVVFSSMKKTVLSPYRTLVSLESSAFYDTASTSEALWIAAEILASFVTTHPSLLRQEVIETPPPAWGPGASPETIAADSSWMHKNILFLLIDLIGNAHDSATIDLLGDCLKAFLDVGKGVVQGKAEKDQGLQQFYDHYIAWLMVPFTDNNTPAEPISNAYYRARGMAALHCVEKYSSLQPHSALSTSRRVLFEVLCLCVASHSYRMKYFLIRSNSIAKIVSKTFSSSDRHLQILSLKFVKQLLKSKDEFYLRHIDKLDLLKPIFLAFKSIAHKDNLLTSNVYDLLETIRVENLSTLILYIVEKYAECFDDVQHVEVFDRLRLRYDQLRDRTQGTSVFSAATASGSSTNNSRPRAQSMDDDEYFFGGDDGESDAASSENGSVDLADEHRDKRFCHDDSMGTQSDSNLPPSFFDKLRHKGTPAKPPSPPHYSHRVHGTPLDGEGPPSDAALNISAHIGPSRSPQSPSGGEVLALLSHYSDDSEDSPFSDTKSLPATEDDSMTHLPPIKPKFSEDHDDEMGFFRARRADGSEMEDKKAGGQDDGAVGGISFVLKKKRAVSCTNSFCFFIVLSRCNDINLCFHLI